MTLSVLILICLSAVIGAVYSVEDNDFNKMVLQKLDELNDKVVKLEQKNIILERETQALKQHIERSTTKRQTGTEIGFSARVPEHLKNLAPHQPIVFGDVMTNLGNYYNPSSGVFFVPVTGTYLFFVNILSEVDNSIETELVVDGATLIDIYSGSRGFFGPGSNFLIARIDKGKNVWVKVHDHYSTNMGVHCCWSSFSGYLLSE
ncbi:hypothetical protein ACF0H5_018625 [Mactra antiquata]